MDSRGLRIDWGRRPRTPYAGRRRGGRIMTRRKEDTRTSPAALREWMKYPVLFFIGGAAYYGVELLFRGYSHPTMFALGGLCFLLCGMVNEHLSWEMPFVLQQAIGALLITALELAFGVVLNRILGLNIWDYSDLPLNFLGQICLPFTAAWFLLAAVAILLDDYLRHWLWHEEMPHYRFFIDRRFIRAPRCQESGG